MVKKLVLTIVCGIWVFNAQAATSKAKSSGKTKAKASITEAVKDPFTFKWVTENYVSGSDLDVGDAVKTTSDNHFSLNYKTSADTTMFLRQYWHFDYDTNESLEIGDIVLGYKSKHGTLAGGWNTSTQMRLYLPLRQYSQTIGQVQYRFYGTVSKPMSDKWNIAFTTNPRLYGYTRYEDGQRALRWKNYMMVGYDAFKKLSINTYIGHAHDNRNTGSKFDADAEPVDWKDPFDNDDSVFLDFEFVAPLTDNLTLIGYITQETDLRSPEPTSFLKSDETLYFIIGVLSI